MGTAKQDNVHRLSDIVVEEVSLVDRAANRRKFLVVKRSEEMSVELQPNGKGGLTTGGTADPTKNEKAHGSCASKTDDKKKKPGAPMAKADFDMPKGAKDPIMGHLEEAQKCIEGVIDMVKKAKEVEPEEGMAPMPMPEALGNELMACMQHLAACEEAWPAPAAPPPPAEGEAPPPPGAEPTPTEMRMLAKAVVEKVGAKMSKERFDRFAQALSVLGSLLNELKPSDAAPAPTTPVAAAAATPAGKTAKTEDEQTTKAIAAIALSVAEIAKAVKTTQGEVASIKKVRGASNAIVVEGDGSPSRGDSGEVSWPLDMNRPVTRNGVRKDESFFDD